MNPVPPWLVCFALFLMLAFAVYVAIKTLRAKTAEIKRLTDQLEGQKRINEELLQYTKELTKINGDKQDVAQQIQEAKNDEEVMAIIAGLVHTNNDRVRK